MSGCKSGVWLMSLLCWMLLVTSAPAQADTTDKARELPASAVQVTPASAVQAVPTPAEDYEAGIKAEEKGDFIGAITLYQRAADAGYAKAQTRYADNLKKGQAITEALKYYRLSMRGNMDGQYGLGIMYEAGEGVKKDLGVARFLYSMAAEQGHRDAAVKMAEAYLRGQMGVDESERQSPEALSWIRRAAGHDYLPALDALAVAYREGKFGLEADPGEADLIVEITNKLRGVVVKEKKKSALFKLLKGDPEKNVDESKKGQ